MAGTLYKKKQRGRVPLLFIFRVEEKMYSLNNGYPNGSSSSPPSLGPSVPPVFPLLPLPSV